MATTAILRPRPWYTPGRLRQGLREMRRFPVLPFIIMMLVLIIPAIFADVIAPHESEKPNPPDRLIPPAWVASPVVDLSDAGSHALGWKFVDLMCVEGTTRFVVACLTRGTQREAS